MYNLKYKYTENDSNNLSTPVESAEPEVTWLSKMYTKLYIIYFCVFFSVQLCTSTKQFYICTWKNSG